MINLTTSYLGLQLKNPLVISSSGLTSSVRKIKILEEKGAGAIVLKSLFEEQITNEVRYMIEKDESSSLYPEAGDYIQAYVKGNTVSEYINLIKEAKAEVSIPIIASINCVSATDWVEFAKEIENAGADAIELNVFVIPSDRNESAQECEQVYFDILDAVKAVVSIPVAVKLGVYFSNLLAVADRLKANGAEGLVLFNRFFEPDVDIEKMELCSSEVLSTSADIRKSLRWVGILSDKVPGIDISASTGIHNGEAAIKQLLVGAQTVQICSTIYENGFDRVSEILDEITEWMTRKEYKDIASFRGKLSYKNISNPALYERSQFMKHFSNNKMNNA